jgi:hypothetical protein
VVLSLDSERDAGWVMLSSNYHFSQEIMDVIGPSIGNQKGPSKITCNPDINYKRCAAEESFSHFFTPLKISFVKIIRKKKDALRQINLTPSRFLYFCVDKARKE